MDLDTALTDKSLCGGATELLRADHEEISRLFDSYQEAMDTASPVRNSLAQAICMQIELHSRVEAEVFYPNVRNEAPDLVAESIEDHEEIAQIIGNLRAESLAIEACDGLMLDLMDLVESHMAAEELELFPLLEDRIPPTLRSLGAEIFRYKEDLMGSTEEISGRS
ncbi:MAG TPA: hemerythrin domain-containing protein [Burkholderiales bacterium]|nr:hemerythrin domain-containing protein [Burkholderiales bacterium]